MTRYASRSLSACAAITFLGCLASDEASTELGDDVLPASGALRQEATFQKVAYGDVSVDLNSVTATGPACTNKDAYAISLVSPEEATKTTLYVRFNDFDVQVVQGDLAGKGCQLKIPVTAAPGTQFAVRTLRFDGTVDIAEGSWIRFTGSVSLDKVLSGVSLSTKRDGPTGIFGGGDGIWVLFDESKSTEWSPCGGTANVQLGASLMLMGGPNAAGEARFGRLAAGVDSKTVVTTGLDVRSCTP